MKKLISIGVALALLTMVVVPGAVAAQIEPDTYAKIPFAIIGSGMELLADIWTIMDPEFEIGMPWIADVLDLAAPWTAGPLAWSVDMLAWGVNLVGQVVAGIPMIADALPEGFDVEALMTLLADGLKECFVAGNCT